MSEFGALSVEPLHLSKPIIVRSPSGGFGVVPAEEHETSVMYFADRDETRIIAHARTSS